MTTKAINHPQLGGQTYPGQPKNHSRVAVKRLEQTNERVPCLVTFPLYPLTTFEGRASHIRQGTGIPTQIIYTHTQRSKSSKNDQK
jgi:hypothetical protein